MLDFKLQHEGVKQPFRGITGYLSAIELVLHTPGTLA